ncbi:MAG: hypothetical protein ND895_14715 [Pyrinomonadaceae bacterium]|nr:hypothetical protein [Pyrinomonadaceae bacterium]
MNLISMIDGWKWSVFAAVAITLLSLYPQFLMWGSQGRDWNGSYAQVHGDEWFYSAYVQALIDGRPRRNDSYTGRDDRPNYPQPESLFSIQFVPAYLIAVPARLLGASSSTAFIVLAILAPFLSCLAISWFIWNLTKDHRLAAAGSIVILCCGALAAGEGVIGLLGPGFQYAFLPFVRRYEPAAPFPLFFVFCTFVWKSLTTDRRRAALTWAIAAGLCLDLLIFSYFYLWTAALAWLVCLALLWFVAQPGKLRKDAGSFVIIILLTLAALVPYVILLSRRPANMDHGQMLILSRAPDLFRIPELLGLAVICLLVFGAWRGRINWRGPASLFAAALSLLPLAVFNQQVITGRSLQPFHYEAFIANYAALIGAFVAVVIIWCRPDSQKWTRQRRLVAQLVVLALCWAALEVVVVPRHFINRDNQFIDRAAAVGQRLRQLSISDGSIAGTNPGPDPRPLVLASDNKLSMILPTFAPQAVLWAPQFDFLNLAPGESRERFYEYLYYTDVDHDAFAKELAKPMGNIAAAAFGHERVLPDLSIQAQPITSEDIAAQAADYQAFQLSFTRERATKHVLSYVVVPVDGGPQLSNLDRWYQRDQGERVGDYILYRVQLRP